MNLERILLNDRARPYTPHDVVPGDDLTGRLHQNREDLERTASQGNGNSTHPQFIAREI
jgi:hypothetical protein